MMKKTLTFNDILIVPNFSFIESRRDVNTTSEFLGYKLTTPIVSSNMSTVTGPVLAKRLAELGSVGALHRFCSIEDNIKMFQEGTFEKDGYYIRPIVSVGVGDKEFERAIELRNVGAEVILLDVASGANINVVNQVKRLRDKLGNSVQLIVGNFATKQSINDFIFHLGSTTKVDAFKVGIGGGGNCATRGVTGCGYSGFSSLIDCVNSGYPIIQDGGMKTSGDICKSLAAGARMVMCGTMLVGTEESLASMQRKVLMSNGDLINEFENHKKYNDKELLEEFKVLRAFHKENGQGILPIEVKKFKLYRGSASAGSYQEQNKVSEWRTPEGSESLVPYIGPVENVIQQINAGLRSSMSYVGAKNLDEYRERSEFIEISHASYIESLANGKI